jgi:hypothetical protein
MSGIGVISEGLEKKLEKSLIKWFHWFWHFSLKIKITN